MPTEIPELEYFGTKLTSLVSAKQHFCSNTHVLLHLSSTQDYFSDMLLT